MVSFSLCDCFRLLSLGAILTMSSPDTLEIGHNMGLGHAYEDRVAYRCVEEAGLNSC